MIVLIYFIFGLIVGSFLNAVIFRLHSKESFLKGRSHCPHCNHVLGPSDLIPVISFLVLRGRCRYCKKKISVQYPIIEIFTGAVFAWLAVSGGEPISLLLVRNFIFASILIIIAVYDWKHYIILDRVIFPSMVVCLFLNIALDLTMGYNLWSLHSMTVGGLVSALILSGFFLFQFMVSRGTWIGFGDVKFGVLLGLILGWPNALAGLFFAYILGALFGLVLIALNRKQMSSKLPFGTFLAFSAIIIMIWGSEIVTWYMGLIGYTV